jgi:hypothetical protein
MAAAVVSSGPQFVGGSTRLGHYRVAPQQVRASRRHVLTSGDGYGKPRQVT